PIYAKRVIRPERSAASAVEGPDVYAANSSSRVTRLRLSVQNANRIKQMFSGGVMVSTKAILQRISVAAVLAAAALWTSPLAAQDAAGLYKAKCSACHG